MLGDDGVRRVGAVAGHSQRAFIPPLALPFQRLFSAINPYILRRFLNLIQFVLFSLLFGLGWRRLLILLVALHVAEE